MIQLQTQDNKSTIAFPKILSKTILIKIFPKNFKTFSNFVAFEATAFLLKHLVFFLLILLAVDRCFFFMVFYFKKKCCRHTSGVDHWNRVSLL